MIIIKIGPNRLFLVNEYWIFIPLFAALNFTIVVILRRHRAQKKNGQSLKNDYRKLKIFHLALGNIIRILDTQVEEEVVDEMEKFIDTPHPNCIIAKGIRYVNNERLRKVISVLYPDKATPNGVIFITRTALCHVAELYGLRLPALPIPVPDFIGVTNMAVSVGRAFSSVLITAPIVILGGLGIAPATIVSSIVVFASGIVGGVMMKNADFIMITTEAFSGPISRIRRRVADQPEVVSIDLEPANDKIRLQLPKAYECSLPEQSLFNPTCAHQDLIIDVIKNAETGDVILDKIIDYDEVVNMEVVTNLKTVEFSDQFDLVPFEKATPAKPKARLRKPKHRSRTANLLEKYGDPKHIPDAETWDNVPGTPHDVTRIRIQDREL